jgi:hypothetical protein
MRKKGETTQPTQTNTIHHANDKTFKNVFKIKEEALTYLRVFFPSLLQHIDVDSFELDNTNYVNKDFEEFFSDVVYRTKLKSTSEKKKQNVAVALLFEHKKDIKSYFLLFIQLLEYIIFIWKQDLANKRKPSIVIPIVVYQGKKGLRVKQLHECFKGIPAELLKYMPNFEYHLTNVQPQPTEKLLAINEESILRSLFLAYKFVEDRDSIGAVILELFKFFKYQPDKLDFFQQLFDFVLEEGYLSADEIQYILTHYLSQIWKQEGKIEYYIEKARSTVLRGKWKGATTSFLADISELPYTDVENMLKEYDKIYLLWQKNKLSNIPTIETKYLTEQEVKYLIDLFGKK